MKKVLLDIGKIVLSFSCIPLWFAKIFKGIGHLPDRESGEIVEVIFRHSMFENVCDATHPILAYVSIAAFIAAVALNAVVLIRPDWKRMRTIGNIVFGVAIGLFIVLLVLAASVGRGY
ncbi:MAG: hypothetical protein IJX80_07505 [Clostridia bacterium]|nr:hypothetical protein [Clostridia bacterium]